MTQAEVYRTLEFKTGGFLEMSFFLGIPASSSVLAQKGKIHGQEKKMKDEVIIWSPSAECPQNGLNTTC